MKFLDPGDGSFLRISMASKESFDPSDYRASFAGELHFAPGATFDLNDYAPYTPTRVPLLSGCPTIVGGEVVAAGWKLSAADILAGKPLTVSSDAVLAFGNEAELTLDLGTAGDAALPHRGGTRYPVLRVADGGVLKSLPKFRRTAGSKWKFVPAADGEGQDLIFVSGFSVIIL